MDLIDLAAIRSDPLPESIWRRSAPIRFLRVNELSGPPSAYSCSRMRRIRKCHRPRLEKTVGSPTARTR
jgi:hypothetical protein